MSTVISKPNYAVRPKVYRLPPAAPVRVTSPRQLKRSTASFLFLSMALGAGMLAVNPMENFTFHDAGTVTMLPTISIGAHETLVEDTSLIGEAHASIGTAAHANVPVAPNAPSPSIISLRGHSDSIVGQITKIPLDNEQITEVKPDNAPENKVSENKVDKPANRELLSIVSKY